MSLINLNTNISDAEIYNYEKYENISKFVDEFKSNHSDLALKYLQETYELDNLDEFTFNDILDIIDKQLKYMQEIIKLDLKPEYLRLLEENKQINKKR